MRSYQWFLLVVGAILTVELVLPSFLGGRSFGAVVLHRVPLSSNLSRDIRAIGLAVSDGDAARLSGAATVEPECTGWDVDTTGCHWVYECCPDDFDTFDADLCTYCDYSASKKNGTRECDANDEHEAEGWCYDAVTISLIGCNVSGQ